jgi:hypothetical protein
VNHEEKKAIERRHAKALLAGRVEYRSIDDSEKPDFWIRRDNASDIGLEVTEYHPTADEVAGVQRREIEARWRDSLEPMLDSLRRTKPELRNFQVRLDFKDPRLPKKKEHQKFAAELLDLVSDFCPRAELGREVNIDFASRADAEQCNRVGMGWTFLAKEEWPHCASHLNWVSMRLWSGIDWPPWSCPKAEVAWIGPEPGQFNHILTDKAAKALGYSLGGCPLWLLIVVDVPGDTKSQLALYSDEDLKELFATFDQCGFDFRNCPFEQVWMLSAMFTWSLPLYPTE